MTDETKYTQCPLTMLGMGAAITDLVDGYPGMPEVENVNLRD